MKRNMVLRSSTNGERPGRHFNLVFDNDSLQAGNPAPVVASRSVYDQAFDSSKRVISGRTLNRTCQVNPRARLM